VGCVTMGGKKKANLSTLKPLSPRPAGNCSRERVFEREEIVERGKVSLTIGHGPKGGNKVNPTDWRS